MIKVDKVDEGLPISVVVPLSKHRQDFFNKFVLPLIEANEPIEIIINNNDGSAPKKRNDGFQKVTQPYVFFCDDDILLPKNILSEMIKTLEKNPEKGYTYCGYNGIVLHPESHPMRGNFKIPSRPFNASALKRGNYISTMSLIRTEHFPMFDERLKRLQDWDIFLTMLKKGIEGVLTPNVEFFAYYLDKGITTNSNNEQQAMMKIISKHNFGI